MMTDYDVPFECACCGNKSTNYLCGKCMAMERDKENSALRSRLSLADAVAVAAKKQVCHNIELCRGISVKCYCTLCTALDAYNAALKEKGRDTAFGVHPR